MLHALLRFASRVRAFLSPASLDRDFDEELASHLALSEEHHRRRGMHADAARRTARLQLGGLAQLREAHREARALPWLAECLGDMRYGLRALARSPGFAATAVLTLSIGIGGNTAMFSVIHSVLLQPLPYPDPDALVFVSRENADEPGWISRPRVESTRASVESFTGLGAYLSDRNFDVNVSGGGEPDVLRGARVSANFLEILGVRPERGRGFLAGEDAPGGAAVAILSSDLWRRRFGARASGVGQTITLDSVPHAVVGVLPDGFAFPYPDVDVWLTRPSETPTLPRRFHDCCVALTTFARLKPGAGIDRARAELALASARYEAASPNALDRGSLHLIPMKDGLTASVDTMLWMLVAAVGFVLLIACANVATLLMARATARSRELAVRAALGAARGRLVRQLLAESLVLALIGGLLGLLFAWTTVETVTRSTILNLPRADEIHVSGIVLAFTAALSLLSGVVFGMVPAWQIVQPRLVDALRQSGAASSSGRHGARRMSALLVAQVALSVVLLVGAALMLRSLGRLAAVDTGFRPEGLLTMRVPLPATRYDTPEKRAAFLDELVRHVEALPRVRGVAVTRALPTTNTLGTNIQIQGQEVHDPGHIGIVMQTVTPGFFDVLGIEVKRGREFTPVDNTPGSSPVVIVSERFARRFWPAYPARTEPLGRRIMVPILGVGPLEVVGVVADVRHSGPARQAPQQFYIPNALYPPQSAYLAIRAEGAPAGLLPAIRDAVREADSDQSVADVRMMDEILDRSVGQHHLVARLLGLFAGAALLLTLVGLCGVLAYSVAQRTREIGIRRTLGAGQRVILGMVLKHALSLTLTGVVCGVAGAFALTRVLDALLFQVSATDPDTFIGVACLFIVAALLAGLIPAVRAASLDPASALRSE